MNRSFAGTFLLSISVLLVCLVFGCDRNETEEQSVDRVAERIDKPLRPFRLRDSSDVVLQETESAIHFEEISSDVGLNFVYVNGAAGRELMVESPGGGVAWFDYDRDGLLDIFFPQGGDSAIALHSTSPSDSLFRQVSAGEFSAVAGAASIGSGEYSMGQAVGDVNNDGFADVYVTNVGANRLFQNLGDGTFIEIADESGAQDRRWSCSAAWGDLDLDGDLDLYCCNYLQYDPLDPLICEKDGIARVCHPHQLDPWPDECFENLGDGTFKSVAEQWGLTGPGNKALGVVIANLNEDSLPDVYVANDTTANFLFLNQGARPFEESAIRFGGAMSAEGALQASMGIAVGDYDSNGFLDLFLTHFTGESNTLYQNLGSHGLHDVSGQTGIRRISHNFLGFGTVMHDFDQDGSYELIVANGHVDRIRADEEVDVDGAGYAQTSCVMTYRDPKWVDVSVQSGDYFRLRRVGRGLAAGDFDNDGDMDVAIANQNQPAALLRNMSARGSWLKVRLHGTVSNRSAIGTRVIVTRHGKTWMQELVGGSSYCATHEHVLIFGMGDSTDPVDVEVIWPGGAREVVKDVNSNQEIVLLESRLSGDPQAEVSASADQN